jgi:hypothetical protein
MAQPTMTSEPVGGGRLRDLRILAQWALLAALVGAAIAQLLGTTFLIGAPLASAVVWPAAGLILGIASHRNSRAGGRALLASAAVVSFLIAASQLLGTGNDRSRETPGGALTTAILAVLAVVAVLAAAGMNRRSVQGTPTVARTGANRATALILVILLTVTVITVLMNAVRLADVGDGTRLVISLVGSEWIAAFSIGLVSWWWGSGWLLTMSGLSTVATIVSFPLGTFTPATVPILLLGTASFVVGLRPPGGRFMGVDVRQRDPRPIRSTVAAVWALSGSLLLIPTLLIGRFPPVLVDCFDSCRPLSPLAGPSAIVDFAMIGLVPIAALVLAFDPTSRPVAYGNAAWIGVVAAVLILGQVVLGQLQTSPFEYMGFTAPAALLILLGFGAAAVRPAGLAGVGRTVALTIGLLAVVWIAAGFASEFGTVWPSHLSAIAEAGVAAVALALAFGRSVPSPISQDGAEQSVPDAAIPAAGA